MTTPTVERAPEQAEQKKQTDPSGAKPDPGERAKLAVTDTAKPAVPGGANPAAGDSAKPDPAESEKKAADEKAKQAADEKTKQAATRRRLILMIVAGVALIAAAVALASCSQVAKPATGERDFSRFVRRSKPAVGYNAF